MLQRLSTDLVRYKSKMSGAIDRILQERLEDTLNAKDFGAKCNGVDDDTIPLNSAATAARLKGVKLVITGSCLTTDTVNFREVLLEASSATFIIKHEGVGVILGGNASVHNNPKQEFGMTERLVGSASIDNPDVRIMGAKCQHISVEKSDYLQLYADSDESVYEKDYSIAYSTFTLKYVKTINIRGINRGWINENQFFLNRIHFVTIQDGNYSHNHNKFFGGTMEEKGAIDIQRGHNNHFFGLRFERDGSKPDRTLAIKFGSYTWNNSIEASWLSSAAYSNEPYNPNDLVTVTDLGRGNAVRHIQEDLTDEVPLLSLSGKADYISSTNLGTVSQPVVITNFPNIYNIRHLVSSKFSVVRNFYPVWESGNLEVRNGDLFTFCSDQPIFRLRLFMLDAQGNVITEQLDDDVAFPGSSWNAQLSMYTNTTNTNVAKIRITSSSRIKYIRLVLMSGGSSQDNIFEYARVTARYYKYSSSTPRKNMDVALASGSAMMPYKGGAEMQYMGYGIPAVKMEDMTKEVNITRNRYSVISVSDSAIKVRVSGTLISADTSGLHLVYTEGSTNKTMPIQSLSDDTITLGSTTPTVIVAGSMVDVICTKQM